MAQTFNSTTYFVQDGGTVTHTTDTNITISSAQCRWRGSSTKLTQESDNESGVSKQVVVPGSSKTFNASAPSEPVGYTLKRIEWYFRFEGSSSQYQATFDLDYDLIDQATTTVDDPVNINGIGFDSLNDSNSDIVVATSTSSDLSLSYDEYDDMEVQVSSDSGNPESLDVKAWMNVVFEESTASETTDPSVDVNSGAGSASYTGTLDDGEWSPWVTMTGMQEGTNNFDHTISGSLEADWEFEYTFTIDLPTAETYVHFEGADGTIVKVIAAQPSDGDLVTNKFRIADDYDNDSTVEALALDAVDPGSTYASEIRIEGPNQTWALRDDSETP